MSPCGISLWPCQLPVGGTSTRLIQINHPPELPELSARARAYLKNDSRATYGVLWGTSSHPAGNYGICKSPHLKSSQRQLLNNLRKGSQDINPQHGLVRRCRSQGWVFSAGTVASMCRCMIIMAIAAEGQRKSCYYSEISGRNVWAARREAVWFCRAAHLLH